MTNPCRFDQSYVVSLKAIRETFEQISGVGGVWRVEAVGEQGVTLSYDPDGTTLNMVCYEFPIIGRIPFFQDDGVLVCLYPMAVKHTRRGLYWEGEELKNDDIQDWTLFWEPFEAAIFEQHQLTTV